MKNIKKETKEDYNIEKTPIKRLEPDYQTGLTNQQVNERKICGWANFNVDPPAQTVQEIIHENVFTYFNLIFAILAVLLCLVGSFRDLTFLPIIIINTLIGIIQEIRAKETLDKLNMLNAPHANVVRNGEMIHIDSENLVIDDIVIFKSGDQICADSIVVNGQVKANESLLTGESDEIEKKTGDFLMSGSFVVAGECYARLTSVGADSYISKLTLEAKSMQKGEPSEMIRSLDRLVKFVGVALIPIGIILFVQSFFLNHETFSESVTSMVAAVIGMIPEGLYLLASMALAVSSMRLAKKKVLLHDMRSIETLARVNVLCVDKTGTITENTMQVKKLVPTRKYDSTKMPELSHLVGDFVTAISNDNSTMDALKKYFTKTTGKKALGITPFTSATKYSGVTFEEKSYVLGAPEFVLREDFSLFEKDIRSYAQKGYRVLVFGEYNHTLTGEALTEPVLPLGYILLANPIRKEAPETFAYFAKQGVDVKVISGDNPLTVSEVAKDAGILNADKYIDSTTLKTEEDITNAITKYTVFGRVTPAQKRQFVQALKAQGKTVAMTGDGVNDVLALKDADCSIAMASGSDAAAQASQLVLLDSNFSCMPSVVMEGRRVVNNIQRSASLFLVKNIFSFLMSLLSAVLMITYPLEPSQISLISMFTIGIPGFFLAFQPNKDIIKGHFITNVILKALPAGITDLIAVAALVICGPLFHIPSSDISTAATLLLAVVGFMILYSICRPLNHFRAAVFILSILGLIACSIFLPKLFALTGMSIPCIILFIIFSLATQPVLYLLTKITKKSRELYKKIKIKKAA